MKQLNREDIIGKSLSQLQLMVGQSIKSYIKKESDIKSFALRAGINRTTLYRLLQGKNSTLETLLRVLRALNRFDLICELLQEPQMSPRERANLYVIPTETIISDTKQTFGPNFDDLDI